MSYIGNQVTSVPFTVDVFSGNGSATSFGPMIRIPATVASVAVFVNGSYRVPSSEYTLNSDYIVFSTPPAVGTNNIVVHHLGNGVMATQVPADGSVTSAKIVPGSITSNTLSSNLSLSVARITEVININTAVIGTNSASGTNVNLDIMNTAVYYFSSNTSGNVTFNLRGNNTTTFNDFVRVGNTISVVVTLRHNTAAHRSGVNVMIDGGRIFTTRSNPDLVTGNLIFFSGNTTANHSPISTMESNVIALNVIKKGDNSYFVLFSNTLFGLT